MKSPISPDARIFVAGHCGMVGSAIVNRLKRAGYPKLLCRSRQDLDLTDARAVKQFFNQESPDVVFLAAARVGGIEANRTYPVEFLYENLLIGANVIHAAAEAGVTKLIFLGSSCIYPRLLDQPIREDHLLTGPLEPTNEAYAIAKIASLKLCEYYQRQYQKRFISVMPTNLYGPGDRFDPHRAHVIPALLRRFHQAKQQQAPSVTVWGSGTPRREFLFVDDLADALLLLLQVYEDPQPINVGIGVDLTIDDLSQVIRSVVGFTGEIVFDTTKPDGVPQKRLDVSRVSALGWQAKTSLIDGLTMTYRWAQAEHLLES